MNIIHLIDHFRARRIKKVFMIVPIKIGIVQIIITGGMNADGIGSVNQRE